MRILPLFLPITPEKNLLSKSFQYIGKLYKEGEKILCIFSPVEWLFAECAQYSDTFGITLWFPQRSVRVFASASPNKVSYSLNDPYNA